jgi:hypothetical protein
MAAAVRRPKKVVQVSSESLLLCRYYQDKYNERGRFHEWERRNTSSSSIARFRALQEVTGMLDTPKI